MPTIAERIKSFHSNREPAYTPLKYHLIAQDPFTFFRGTCHLFYEDMQNSDPLPKAPTSWICGDLHIENFGSYKGDNRLVYFDISDFDEAALGSPAWELTRFLTSVFIALDAFGIKQKEISREGKLFLRTYSEMLSKAKTRYIEQQTASGIVKTFLSKVCDRKQKELLRERTVMKAGKPRLRVDNARLFTIEKPLKKELTNHLEEWIKHNSYLRDRYDVVDAGFRIAGTGSIGVKRYLFLLRKNYGVKKYLLIDMKQSLPSSLHPYLTTPQPQWASTAERVVAIQERMQNIPPALLSVTTFKDESYVVKEMQPSADKIQLRSIRNRQGAISSVIATMAMLTSSAHLRSSGRQGAAVVDELIEFGKDVHWHEPVLKYAYEYSRQVTQDHTAYLKDYKAGFFNM